MEIDDAIRVVRIMVHHSLRPDKMIASFLTEFDIPLVGFFNEAEFLKQPIHDEILARLDELRKIEERRPRRQHSCTKHRHHPKDGPCIRASQIPQGLR